MHRMSVPLLITVFILSLSLMPSTIAQDEEHWSDNEIDPGTWTDGPTLEGSPMDNSSKGNPVVKMTVQYSPNLGSSSVEGEIILEIFPEWVPITTSNFIGLAEESFWNGIFFHRVIDDFVIQSGDPRCETLSVYPATNIDCGSGGSGETIILEHDENMSHVDGAIGMARGVDEDSAESQFYICDQSQHGLDPENRDDGGYATFGVVRDGMTHVRAIAEVPTSNDPLGIVRVPLGPDRPAEEVRLISVEMIGVVGEGSSPYDGDGNSTAAADDGPQSALWILFVLMMVFAGLMVAGAHYTTIMVRKNRGEEAFQPTPANLFKGFFKYGLFWAIPIVYLYIWLVSLATTTGSVAGGFGGLGMLIICFGSIILILLCMMAWAAQLKYVTVVQLATVEELESGSLNPYDVESLSPDTMKNYPTSNAYDAIETEPTIWSRIGTIVGIVVSIVLSALFTFGDLFFL